MIDDFLAAHPDIDRIDVLFSDINGVLRGKWLPRAGAAKIASGGVRLPVSTSALDIWGHDVDGSGLGIVSGDKDGIGRPVMETLVPVPWAARPSAQIIMTLDAPDGGPSLYEPRHRLAAVVERYKARGLTPVIATELEFFIFAGTENDGTRPSPPAGSRASHLYDFSPMEAAEPVLLEIEAACRAQSIPSDMVIAEAGQGQFEINFSHIPDALAAADYAVMFRRLVRGIAARHGMQATFMAKPYGGDVGSGMHVHVSVLDAAGRNIFDGGDGMAPALRHAVGGVLQSMEPFQAIFAPNLNSYRRFDLESFAPTRVNSGQDHRGAAVRIPETTGKGARFEHRVAGADVNPYLAIAAILGGALDGMDRGADPGPPIEAGGEAGLGLLTWDWLTAVERFAADPIGAAVLDAEFCRVFTLMKRYEIKRFSTMVTDVERRTYLGRI